MIGSDIEKGLFVWTLAAQSVPATSGPSVVAAAALLLAATALVAAGRRGRGAA